MNWTDSERSIEVLFERTLLPIHKELKPKGKALFPQHPDPSLNSFYISRKKTRMNREDFEVAAYEGAAGFASALRRLWDDGSEIDLTGTIGKHAEAARALAEDAEEQTEEVSPFTYVMF